METTYTQVMIESYRAVQDAELDARSVDGAVRAAEYAARLAAIAADHARHAARIMRETDAR